MSRRPGLFPGLPSRPVINPPQIVKPGAKPEAGPVAPIPDVAAPVDNPFPKEIVTPEYRHQQQEDDDGLSLVTKLEIGLGVTIGIFILLAVLEK